MLLREYREEIGRLVDSDDLWGSRVSLRYLSLEIRRIAWNPQFHAEAMEVARIADAAAAEIESATPGMMPTSRLPRWESVIQGGIRSAEYQ